jgi:hypothetical protein
MFKKLIAAGATLAVAVGIVALVAAPAQAHTAAVSAQVACSGANTSTITWTVTNDWGTAGKIDSVTGTAKGLVSPEPINVAIPAKANGANGSYKFTQTVTGTASYTLGFHVTWSDYNANTNLASAKGLENCTTPVAAGTVTAKQSVCDTYHPGQTTSASYNIVSSSDKVHYAATVNGGGVQVVQPGSHPVTVGSSQVVVVVTATTDTGYALTGYPTGGWTLTFAPVQSDCLSHLTVAGTPHVTQAACTSTGTYSNGSVSFDALPKGAKWQYSLTSAQGPWTDVTGSITASAGSTVYAQIVAEPGYKIDGGKTSFTEVVDAVNSYNCVSPAQLTPKQAVCDATNPGKIPTGSFDVPSSKSVAYTYNGSVVNGTTQTVTVGSSAVTVHVTATPKPGYVFPNGVTSVDIPLVFQPLDHTGCIFPATSAVPQVSDAVCTTAAPGGPGVFTSGYYLLPDAVGITYQVSLDGGKTFTTVPADQVNKKVAVAAGTLLQIKESVDPTEYTLTGKDFYSYPADTFSKTAADCLTDTPSVKAGVTDEKCTVDGDGKGTFSGSTIDITVVDHVTYSVDGNKVDTKGAAEGTVFSVTVKPGVAHTVTAEADSGYKLNGYPTGGWSLTPAAAEACGDLVTHPLVDPGVVSTTGGCFTPSTYTLSNDLDALYPEAVLWTVNGSPVDSGTYKVSGARTLTVHATPAPGYGFATGTQSDWTLTFAAATSCDLKTLALTGTGNPAGWIGLGYLLLVLGTALVAIPMIRRRRSAE